MRKIDVDELKKLQMDVLDVIHSFCVEHGIKYSLGCGTLLGAIRHKGYIPWDDDIDIYMLRSEYERLMKEFPVEYQNVSIFSLERNNAWIKAYAKAFDVRTVCFNKRNEAVQGVDIDIFPIDNVPQSERRWKSFNLFRKIIHRLYESKSEGFTKDRALYRNAILCICKIIAIPFSSKQIIGFFNKYIQRYNAIQSDYVFESCQGMLQKNRFKKSYMEQLIDLPFEDRLYKGMKEYDGYLKCGFGDYMKLPPIEDRKSHHRINAWWK